MKKLFVAIAVTVASLSVGAQGKNPGGTCFEDLNSDPALARLLPHVGSFSKSDSATFGMIVSKEKPSEADKKAIIAWGRARDNCIKIYRENLPEGFPPELIEVEAASQSELQQLLATLYRGQMTYGEFVESRKKLGEAKISKFRIISDQNSARQRQEMTEKIQQGIADRQREQQQEQYQAAIQAQKEADSRAQFNNGINLLLQARPRPVMPSLSPSINCTSRPSFGSVVTNCN